MIPSSRSHLPLPVVLFAGLALSLFSGRAATDVTSLWQTGEDGIITSGDWNFYNDGSTTHGELVAQNTASVGGAGNLTFFGVSQLTTTGLLAINGGTETFLSQSKLNAGSYGIVAGNQIFNDFSELNASAVRAVSGGAQTFSGSAKLNASSFYAIVAGTQEFYGTSGLVASEGFAVNGGIQQFNGSSTLQATAADAIADGSQAFYDASTLHVSVASAISGGTQRFNGSSVLNVTAAAAVNGGSQEFNANSVMNVSAAGAISGGEQVFQGNSTLNANVAGALGGATIVLSNSGKLAVNATNALGDTATVRFGEGGIIELGGHSTTVGIISPLSAGGTIRNAAAAPATITVSGSGPSGFTGLIEDGDGGGALSLVKAGTGTLEVAGQNNTYTGGTIINGGTLLYTANGALGTGAIIINADGTLATSPFKVIGNDLTVAGTISPGTAGAPITKLTTGKQTWEQGGVYRWDLADATGNPNSGWDLLQINDALTINSTSLNPFSIALSTFSGITPGNAANFDPDADQQWLIASATGGIFGLTVNNYAINSSGFLNPVSPLSVWRLKSDGNNLFLTYTAVPEPGAWGAMGLGLAAFVFLRRRVAARA